MSQACPLHGLCHCESLQTAGESQAGPMEEFPISGWIFIHHPSPQVREPWLLDLRKWPWNYEIQILSWQAICQGVDLRNVPKLSRVTISHLGFMEKRFLSCGAGMNETSVQSEKLYPSWVLFPVSQMVPWASSGVTPEHFSVQPQTNKKTKLHSSHFSPTALFFYSFNS